MFRAALSLLRYRSLLATLTGRELKARYRGSFLGYFWSLLNPLLMLGVYTFVFGVIFKPRDATVTPYAPFLITGLFPWIWFQSSLLEGTSALQANAGLIRKATFPIELLPVVSVLSNLFHFAFAMPVVALAFVGSHFYGQPIGSWTALLLPAIVLLQLPMIAGLTLGFAALGAHFKDVKDILTNLLTVLFFMTPILYSLDMLAQYPRIQALIRQNPLTPFVLSYQDVLFHGRVPEAERWMTMGVISLVGWAGGAWLFDRLAETLVEAV